MDSAGRTLAGNDELHTNRLIEVHFGHKPQMFLPRLNFRDQLLPAKGDCFSRYHFKLNFKAG